MLTGFPEQRAGLNVKAEQRGPHFLPQGSGFLKPEEHRKLGRRERRELFWDDLCPYLRIIRRSCCKISLRTPGERLWE